MREQEERLQAHTAEAPPEEEMISSQEEEGGDQEEGKTAQQAEAQAAGRRARADRGHVKLFVGDKIWCVRVPRVRRARRFLSPMSNKQAHRHTQWCDYLPFSLLTHSFTQPVTRIEVVATILGIDKKEECPLRLNVTNTCVPSLGRARFAALQRMCTKSHGS